MEFRRRHSGRPSQLLQPKPTCLRRIASLISSGAICFWQDSTSWVCTARNPPALFMLSPMYPASAATAVRHQRYCSNARKLPPFPASSSVNTARVICRFPSPLRSKTLKRASIHFAATSEELSPRIFADEHRSNPKELVSVGFLFSDPRESALICVVSPNERIRIHKQAEASS